MTFQYYGNIFIASYIKREIKCDGQTYSFVKIKDSILSRVKTLIKYKPEGKEVVGCSIVCCYNVQTEKFYR